MWSGRRCSTRKSILDTNTQWLPFRHTMSIAGVRKIRVKLWKTVDNSGDSVDKGHKNTGK